MAIETTHSDSTMSFSVRPLSQDIGGEVCDFDLRKLIGSKDNSGFVRRLCEYGLLVFRDQILTPDDFAAISSYLGKIEYHVLDQYRMAEQPEIYVISNIVENGKPVGNPRDGFGWHTDLSYMAQPTAYTVLYGVETPRKGADTLFTSTYLAYEKMPSDLRSAIETLKGVHSYTYMRTRSSGYVAQNTKVTLTASQVSRVPDVSHPLVRRHPLTGRRSLYLGGDCLAGIAGLPDAEARPLIDRLFALALSPELQFVQRWQPRDVVMWDNRGLMHTATDYDREKYRRLIWRTSIRGEVPV